MDRNKVAMLVKAMGDRIKVFADAVVFFDYLKEDWSAADYDPASVENRLRHETSLEIITKVATIFGNMDFPAWCEDEALRQSIKGVLDPQLRGLSVAMNVKFLVVMQTIRVAVTGIDKGMDMYDALFILGRDKVINRLQFSLQQFTLAGDSIKEA